ncbi:hypothetical protein HDU89_003547, partial [Geranomyces variabilis]
ASAEEFEAPFWLQMECDFSAPNQEHAEHIERNIEWLVDKLHKAHAPQICVEFDGSHLKLWTRIWDVRKSDQQ